jgi:hypothetical protein
MPEGGEEKIVVQKGFNGEKNNFNKIPENYPNIKEAPSAIKGARSV